MSTTFSTVACGIQVIYSPTFPDIFAIRIPDLNFDSNGSNPNFVLNPYGPAPYNLSLT